jgi:sugar fermentation stimulation protein A
MKYNKVVKGRFIKRPNRFIAEVETDGKIETVHVKNTGRCRELLVPGCTVYLAAAENPDRKTRFDLIAVEKLRENAPPLLINMDSQIPNDAAEEWLRSGRLFPKSAVIRREVRYGSSRFDFYIENGDEKAFLEVKGVTLENGGRVFFPDAPTERGIKHINELIGCLNDGYSAYILFVIQMKGVKSFSPNYETHPEFGEALKRAKKLGVRLIAMDCVVAPDSINLDSEVEILFT